MTDGYGDDLALAVTADSQDVVADDVLLPVAAAWPIPERTLAAGADGDHVLALGCGVPAPDRAPRPLDRIADAVIATDVLSRQSDDGAAAARSRQSA